MKSRFNLSFLFKYLYSTPFSTDARPFPRKSGLGTPAKRYILAMTSYTKPIVLRKNVNTHHKYIEVTITNNVIT